jgi:hypothetical protein
MSKLSEMAGIGLINLYARKEPTKDAVSICRGLGKKMDTVLYRDPECSIVAARWPWYYSRCPRRGQKRVIFNCFKWNLVWTECLNGSPEKPI